MLEAVAPPPPAPEPQLETPAAPVVVAKRKRVRLTWWQRRSALRTARIGGLIGALMMVLLGGHLAAPVGQQAPTAWFGLLGAYAEPWQRGVAGTCLIGGLWVISWAFLRLVRLADAGLVTVRQVAATAFVWATPYLAGPPLMSLDVHSYVAQGDELARGVDPYRYGPEFIRDAVYNATDPRWRSAHAPYGPLALLESRMAYSLGAHSAVTSVVILRVVALLAVVACAVLATRMAANPAYALAVASCCPVVLVTLLSAAHHEALMTGFIVAALAAQRARCNFLAVVFGAAAVADKLPGAVALGAVAMLHLLEATGWRERLWVVVRDAAGVAVVWVPLSIAVPDPFGWVNALSTPALGHTGYAPVSLVAFVTRIPENLVRDAAEVLSVLIVARLLLTLRRRELAATVGWGLLTVALLGPVLYPWYLAPAAIVLAMLPGLPARFMAAACGVEGMLFGWPRRLLPVGASG